MNSKCPRTKPENELAYVGALYLPSAITLYSVAASSHLAEISSPVILHC